MPENKQKEADQQRKISNYLVSGKGKKDTKPTRNKNDNSNPALN